MIPKNPDTQFITSDVDEHDNQQQQRGRLTPIYLTLPISPPARMAQKSTDPTTAAANRAIQQALPALKKYEWLQQSHGQEGPRVSSERRSVYLEEYRPEKPDAEEDHREDLLDGEEADAQELDYLSGSGREWNGCGGGI
ncbi:Hypothetical predicted protein [Lecanosticta acicola]|uniref:Uncharacterized protein n=1 Tax=Lecanosticta acicola TaxID=111012 RepID=A0AAI8YX08_9PEZI|nr:Hypothetical predicted protein [Lecanosticta acicola]